MCSPWWLYLNVSDTNQNYDFKSRSLVTKRWHWYGKVKILHMNVEDLTLTAFVPSTIPNGLRGFTSLWMTHEPAWRMQCSQKELKAVLSLNRPQFQAGSKVNTLPCGSQVSWQSLQSLQAVAPAALHRLLLLPRAALRAFVSQTLLAALGLCLSETGKQSQVCLRNWSQCDQGRDRAEEALDCSPTALQSIWLQRGWLHSNTPFWS